MSVYSLNDSQWQYKAVTWKYLPTESYQSSLIPTWSPTPILRHFIHQDCYLISISTWGCCFSDVRTGCLLQVRSHKAKYVCRNWWDEASGFFWRHMWKSPNHPVVWVFKLSCFFGQEAKLWLCDRGIKLNQSGSHSRKCKNENSHKVFRTINLIWGWTMSFQMLFLNLHQVLRMKSSAT